jgi:hypothetical protein
MKMKHRPRNPKGNQYHFPSAYKERDVGDLDDREPMFDSPDHSSSGSPPRSKGFSSSRMDNDFVRRHTDVVPLVLKDPGSDELSDDSDDRPVVGGSPRSGPLVRTSIRQPLFSKPCAPPVKVMQCERARLLSQTVKEDLTCYESTHEPFVMPICSRAEGGIGNPRSPQRIDSTESGSYVQNEPQDRDYRPVHSMKNVNGQNNSPPLRFDYSDEFAVYSEGSRGDYAENEGLSADRVALADMCHIKVMLPADESTSYACDTSD